MSILKWECCSHFLWRSTWISVIMLSAAAGLAALNYRRCLYISSLQQGCLQQSCFSFCGYLNPVRADNGTEMDSILFLQSALSCWTQPYSVWDLQFRILQCHCRIQDQANVVHFTTERFSAVFLSLLIASNRNCIEVLIVRYVSSCSPRHLGHQLLKTYNQPEETWSSLLWQRFAKGKAV